MTETNTEAARPKADKYCGQCGQKNFRPNRSLKELFTEFVEDWLGYDSKIYKTSAKLIKPAALSLDYFSNSHHKNHYITPIRLYLLFSILFFIMTKFGGFSLTEIEFNQTQTDSQEVSQAKIELEKAIKQAESEPQRQALETALSTFENTLNVTTESTGIDSNEPQKEQSKPNDDFKLVITQGKDFSLNMGCKANSEEYFNIWPNWLDNMMDRGMEELCESYKPITYLPKNERVVAARSFALSLAQNAVELVPQTFFLSLPILALLLSLFYFLSKRLYVEHLVLLMHSHSFIFAATLFYLGWYQFTASFESLKVFPMGPLLFLYGTIYLYLSQKWFYKRGWWATLWRFLIFSFAYITLTSILLTFGIILGILLSA